ncbi:MULTISPECIES: helix-turn-helix domain-containing protein [unclassified Fibrobacter]|uniref:AlbA family DNA-binding domain-containing protein n=1 Tax=unclassified Fibrobacter TaxID=2634177 RepID=UPI000D6D350E|nr:MULTISPECIES: ATP-binding protein [unclassified Fibrobacter]PWJ61393.1 putative DNA-binding protein [Fibrobacter sp. UWR4]PZW65528.1 putative DNA-binding protein [Fibrobacter sp. UWR1]
MLYKPFKNEVDFLSFIHFDETSESIHWDYKQSFNSNNLEDIAIDLAAFANTFGGILLIGVAETSKDGRKVASGFIPNIDIEFIRKKIHTQVRDLISPNIEVQVVPIVVNSNLIAAVNVEPSVNLVGVCLNRDRLQYCFPYRTEFGNRFMTYEDVEKRMIDNRSRSMFLKLKKHIVGNNSVVIYPNPRGGRPSKWFFEWIENSDDVFKLVYDNKYSVNLPFSSVHEVWPGDNHTCLRLNHQLYCGQDYIDFEDSERVQSMKLMQSILNRSNRK